MVSTLNYDRQIPIDNKYKLLINRKLGFGAFGDVYQGTNIITHSNESRKNQHQQLKNEYDILSYLKGVEGIPNSYCFIQRNDYNCLVMDYLGPSLESLLSKFSHHFSLKTITRIEYIHQLHIIHRDIKPNNFLIGQNEKNNIIYLTDFGLSKRFRNRKTGDHIPYKDGKNLTGTARYSSIYTHLGIEQSRRDDLESLIYTLIYLYHGSLPWQDIPSKTKDQKYQKMLELKISIKEEILFKDLPEEFNEILTYVRNLQFEEKPDYELIKNKFMNVIEKFNFSLDWNFDWVVYSNRSLFSRKASKEITLNSNNTIREDEKQNNNIPSDICIQA